MKGRIGGFKGDNFVLQGTQAVLLVLIQNVVDVPRIGNAARDIPVETQMLLLEATANSSMHALSGNSPFYILLLPLIDGAFRSSLQGNSANELEVCVESGKFCSSYLSTHVFLKTLMSKNASGAEFSGSSWGQSLFGLTIWK